LLLSEANKATPSLLFQNMTSYWNMTDIQNIFRL